MGHDERLGNQAKNVWKKWFTKKTKTHKEKKQEATTTSTPANNNNKLETEKKHAEMTTQGQTKEGPLRGWRLGDRGGKSQHGGGT